jgi:acyl dehydratase
MTTNLTSMAERIGQELGVSAWQTVDQARIKEFAQCTGDRQWIHVDVERAQRDSPFGGTIAHGFLTLATLAPAAFEIWIDPAGIGQAFNYGIDRLRFINPVKAGARIRSRIKLLAVEPKSGGRLLVTTENTVEIEGEDKPALIATMLAMVTAPAEDTKPREQPTC